MRRCVEHRSYVTLPKVKVTIRSEVKLRLKSGLNNNKRSTQTNLKKLHRKIKHNKKVCQTQELGSHIKGQGLNQGLEVKYFLCDYLKLAEAHCIRPSKKVSHN